MKEIKMSNMSGVELDVIGILSKTLGKIAKANGSTVNTEIQPSTTLKELAGLASRAGVADRSTTISGGFGVIRCQTWDLQAGDS